MAIANLLGVKQGGNMLTGRLGPRRAGRERVFAAEDHFSDPESAVWQSRLGIRHPMAVARVPLVRVAELLSPTGEAAGLTNWLSQPEVLRLQALTLDKRRQEWLGGRLAAKHASCRALILAGARPVPVWAELAVTNRPTGRPELALLSGVPRFLPDISISHSHGWAMAMAVMGAPCGIDLQIVSLKTVALQDRFCLARERDEVHRRMGALTPPERGLSLLWAAKEAVRKVVAREALPGFLEIELVAASCPAVGQWVLEFTLGPSEPGRAVAACFWGDFALAFTVADEHGCLDCRL
jgi:phosphopantetheinyl transferase (holo-ACP synthase)